MAACRTFDDRGQGMAEFGRRNADRAGRFGSQPSRAQVMPDEVKAVIEVIATGRLPRWTNVSLRRAVTIMFAIAGAYCAFVLPSVLNLVRDYRLGGTWQPAYDMQTVVDRCTRINLTLVHCEAKIKSRAEPDRKPIKAEFDRPFTTGGIKTPLPVRSTKDPSVVTIDYTAETDLSSRALDLLLMTALFAAVLSVFLSAVLRGRYRGGAAHLRLLSGVTTLQSRSDSAPAERRAAA
jgi:hypothetical protein